jgi:hypothetical protein
VCNDTPQRQRQPALRTGPRRKDIFGSIDGLCVHTRQIQPIDEQRGVGRISDLTAEHAALVGADDEPVRAQQPGKAVSGLRVGPRLSDPRTRITRTQPSTPDGLSPSRDDGRVDDDAGGVRCLPSAGRRLPRSRSSCCLRGRRGDTQVLRNQRYRIRCLR